MSRDLTREIGRTRRAEARHRRLVQETRPARRSRRREERGSGWRRFLRRPDEGAGSRTPLAAAPALRPEDVSVEVARLLEQVAGRIAECGTEAERFTLQVMAEVTRPLAPGSAAALVDWQGTETARLRAFGAVHGIVLHLLDMEGRSWLLDELRGTRVREQDCRVA